MAVVIKRCNDIVAHKDGVKRALKKEANRIEAMAAGVLSQHRAEGHARITVTKGKLDYYVNLDDTRGDKAAAAIEYGHMDPRGFWVEGIHALTRSFRR